MTRPREFYTTVIGGGFALALTFTAIDAGWQAILEFQRQRLDDLTITQSLSQALIPRARDAGRGIIPDPKQPCQHQFEGRSWCVPTRPESAPYSQGYGFAARGGTVSGGNI